MSKFSVIVPLYNKEYSVKRCIDSVLNQKTKFDEIIIVNDGSTDSSLSVIESNYIDEINDKKIVLTSQSNQGVSVARNKGISLAKSKYICFLDADDEWKDDFLTDIEFMISKYPDAVMYSTQHESLIDNTVLLRNNSYYKDNYIGLVDNFFRSSMYGSIANSSKVCLKKEVMLNIGGFPEGHKSGEDLYVWMKIALSSKIAFYNKVSVRINVSNDHSRLGRSQSIPYPFIYYSHPNNINELSLWGKLYLRKIYLVHLKDSLQSGDYESMLSRASAGKRLFPILSRSIILFSLIKYKN